MHPSVRNKVEELAIEASEQASCLFYDLELVGRGRFRVLRVFIDSERGVGLEDCESVSRHLSLLLDAEDAIGGEAYNLEVSSPGLERKLTKMWHFKKSVGEEAQVKTENSQGVRTLKAKIVSAEAGGLELELPVKKASETRTPQKIIVDWNHVVSGKVILQAETKNKR